MILYDHLGGIRRPGGRTRVPAILTYAAPPPENIPDLGAWCRPGGSGLGGHRCALCPRRSGGSRIARIQKQIQTDSNSNFPFEYVGNRFYSKTTEKITHTYLYKMYDSYRTWTCSLWVRSPTHYLLCQWALSILRPIYNNRLIYMCSQWAATHFTNKKEGAALNLPIRPNSSLFVGYRVRTSITNLRQIFICRLRPFDQPDDC